jgi:hypothetical protein
MKLIREILALIWKALKAVLRKWLGKYIRKAVIFAFMALAVITLVLVVLIASC